MFGNMNTSYKIGGDTNVLQSSAVLLKGAIVNNTSVRPHMQGRTGNKHLATVRLSQQNPSQNPPSHTDIQFSCKVSQQQSSTDK